MAPTQDGARAEVKEFTRTIGDRKIKHRIAAFRKRGWSTWLRFRLDLEDLRVSLDYDNTDDSIQSFAMDIRQLLTGVDLQMFTNEARRAGDDYATSVQRSLNVLTQRHCPTGTRDDLMNELQRLKKTKNMSVADYTDKLAVRRQVQFLTGAESGDLSLHELRRYYGEGMPVEWQVKIREKEAQPTTVDELFDVYQRIEFACRVEPESDAPRSELQGDIGTLQPAPHKGAEAVSPQCYVPTSTAVPSPRPSERTSRQWRQPEARR